MRQLEPSVVILQARMSSRRLPGKALKLLAGRPLVTHCLERLTAAGVGPVVLATTTARADDVLVGLGEAAGVRVVRGPEHDVLARFAMVLAEYPARVVIRATADNPVVDTDGPARVLRWLDEASADYVVEDGLPYGTAVEAILGDALVHADRIARDSVDREHVTTWIKRHTERFRVHVVSAPGPVRRPDLRLTSIPLPTSSMCDVSWRQQGLVTESCRSAASSRSPTA